MIDKLPLLTSAVQRPSGTALVPVAAPEVDPVLGTIIAALARGPAVNLGGRAPVLRLLQSSSRSCSPYLFVEESCHHWPGDAAAIRTAWNTGMLRDFIMSVADPGLVDFDQRLGMLHVRSEPLRSALHRADWAAVERDLPHLNLSQDVQYDVALSFATEERPYIEHLFAALVRLGYSVFYDFNEQDRLFGAHVDDFLERVFTRDSRFVVVMPSNAYGRRRSHTFEAQIIRSKVERERILPIFDLAHPSGPFDELFVHGYLWLDLGRKLRPQAAQHAEIISKKIAVEVLAKRRERL